MTRDVLGQLERLSALGIRLLPAVELTTHFIFERGGAVVLVERRGDGFGAVGSPGRLESGGRFAALVMRGGGDWFVAKNESWPAEGREAEAARQLFSDVKSVIENH